MKKYVKIYIGQIGTSQEVSRSSGTTIYIWNLILSALLLAIVIKLIV